MERDNRTSPTGRRASSPLLTAINVDVIDTSARRRSSPFASPSGALRTVQEGQAQVRLVSPSGRQVQEEGYEVAIAQAERTAPPSPRRRGTPTTSRRPSSHRVTYEDLVSRPRSNPRSRTPMRYESPLEHGAFRRETDDDDEDDTPQDTFQPRAITIRPGAGMGVGETRAMAHRPHFDDTSRRPQPITVKSTKQGPSQRKSRRWNNDNLSNSYNELKNSSSAKGRAAAEVLAAAKADARHFLPMYDPSEKQRSAQVTSFMEDEKYSTVRDKFFSGELNAKAPRDRPSNKPRQQDSSADLSPADLFLRIDGRLRRVVAKACENSEPACKVVGYFEDYLVEVFDAGKEVDCDFWEELLLEKPKISYKSSKGNKKTMVVTFHFDGNSSTGGFHRLLVHAISHFHCLKANTSTLDEDTRKARVLTVQGVMRGGEHSLLDHLESLQQAKQRQ